MIIAAQILLGRGLEAANNGSFVTTLA